MSGDDVKVMTTAELDLAMRLELIHRAKRSIDIAIYEQTADPTVGLPVLSALRDAANRGVKVRFVTSWVAMFAKDRKGAAPDYAVNPPAKTPIEYVIFGGKKQKHRGWGISDQLHEKLLIVDDEVTLATGRGHSESYLHWLDTSFLIQGALARQSAEAFEALWQAVRQEHEPFAVERKKLRPASEVRSYLPPESMRLDAQETSQLTDMMAWLDRGPAPVPAGSALRGRVLHLDFVNQYQRQGYRIRGGIYGRARTFVDPVIDAVVAKLPGAKSFRYTTLSPMLNPKFREAMRSAGCAGTDITIFTNGIGAGYDPFNVPYRIGLFDLRELLPIASIHARGLVRDMPGNPWTYLHRKLAVLDDTVVFGSHNLNLPSSTYNDELSFEVEDPAFAQALRAQFDADMARSSAEITLPEVEAQIIQGRSAFGALIGRWLRGFM